MNRKLVGYLTIDHPSIRSKVAFYEGNNIIGRVQTKTDICIKDKTISQNHCNIFTKDGKIFIMDLGSRNGVCFESQQNPLLPKQPFQITPDITTFEISEIKCKIQLTEQWANRAQRKEKQELIRQQEQQKKGVASQMLQQESKFIQIQSKTQQPRPKIQQQKNNSKLPPPPKPSKAPKPNKAVRFNNPQSERRVSLPPAEVQNQVRSDKHKKRSGSNDTKPKGGKREKKQKNKKKQPTQAQRKSKRIIHEITVMITCFRPTFEPNSRIKITQDLKSDFDLLLMGEQYRRTVKFYLAILKGVPIVSYEWLIRSENAFRILPYEKFEVKQDAQIIKASLEKVRQGFKVFDGIIFNFPNDPKEYHLAAQNISLLIQKAGGKYMRSIAKSKAGNFKCILPKQPRKEDIEKCKKVTNEVYTIDLLLDSIFYQELNLQKHRL